MKREGKYIGAKGKQAGYDIEYNQNKKQALIVFCHGFNGFKDWGAFNLMAHYFVQNGFQFVKLNFSHNGTSPMHPLDFVDLDAFGNNNFENEIYDISALLEQLKREDYTSVLDFGKVFLIGHSKGGATALAYSLSHQDIVSCATLAGVLDPVSRYGKVNDTQWRENGVKYVTNGRTNQKMPMFYQLAENTQKIKSQLDIRNLIEADKRKFLFIQGTNDSAVPVTEINLVKNLPNCFVAIYEDADHVFGASHPYESDDLPAHLQQALSQILIFFQLFLERR